MTVAETNKGEHIMFYKIDNNVYIKTKKIITYNFI